MRKPGLVAAMTASIAAAATATTAQASQYFQYDFFDIPAGVSTTYTLDVKNLTDYGAVATQSYEFFFPIPTGEKLESTQLWSERFTNMTDCQLQNGCGHAQLGYGPNTGLSITMSFDADHLYATFTNLGGTYFHCNDPGAQIGKTCAETYGLASFTFAGYADEVGDLHITTNAVPEPATWAMMITGFGLVGATARRQRRRLAAAPTAA